MSSATHNRSMTTTAIAVALTAAACGSGAGPSVKPSQTTATAPPSAAPSPTTSAAPGPAGGSYIPVPPGGPVPEWERAVQLFRQANTLQFEGRLDEAIAAYRQSLAAFPTAEAYTFLGWTYSWKGRLEDAIVEARKAIELDPAYGNPYNDIGMYLIELGRLDEAIHWLHEAIKASRYEERQFPHLNLGRIWTRKGLIEDAFGAFETCLRAWRKPSLPDFPAVKVVIAATSDASPAAGLLAELREALDAYFHAWNTYDAEALVDASTPHPPEVTEAVLLHLARAKLRGERMTLGHVEPLRVDDAAALVEANVQRAGASERIQYVLRRDQGVWKVMGPAVVDVENAAADVIALSGSSPDAWSAGSD